MDSARLPRLPRQRLFERDTPAAVEEGEGEGFEEVGLDDEDRRQNSEQQLPPPPQLKKRGFFSKFSDHSQENGGISPVASPSPTSTRFSILPGRKRGQSGQGAELGFMEKPRAATKDAAREMTDVSAQA